MAIAWPKEQVEFARIVPLIPISYNQLDRVLSRRSFSEPQTDTEYHSDSPQEEIFCTTGQTDRQKPSATAWIGKPRFIVERKRCDSHNGAASDEKQDSRVLIRWASCELLG